VWLGLVVAGVCAVWALLLSSGVIELATSEEPLFDFWVPGAAFGVLLILMLGVLPNAYMAWRFRKKASMAATAIALASIVAIVTSYFVAQARYAALWNP
jgi:hypothetical protein